MPKVSQGDIVTITAVVELSVSGGAQIVYRTPNGAEARTQVADTSIIDVKPGQLKAGDRVTKDVTRNKVKTTLTGVVAYRGGKKDRILVDWDDETEEPSIEKPDVLTRA